MPSGTLCVELVEFGHPDWPARSPWQRPSLHLSSAREHTQENPAWHKTQIFCLSSLPSPEKSRLGQRSAARLTTMKVLPEPVKMRQACFPFRAYANYTEASVSFP